MKLITMLLTLGLAASLYAGEQCHRAKGKEMKQCPKGDSALCQTMKEGKELHHAVMEARHAYGKAVTEGKDQEARKTELLAAMDKHHAFEVAHVEDMAKCMAKCTPKDGEGPCCKKDKDGKKGKHGKQCDRSND